MKKVLIATTALIATAGIASAEATVGGFGYAGVLNNGTTTDATSAVRLTFTAAVETDAGVSLKAETRATIADSAKTAATDLERGRVTISSGNVSVVFGGTHGAMRMTARNPAFLGFNDGGTVSVDNSRGVANNNDGGNNIYASYSNSGLTVGISSDINGAGLTEFGVKYAAGAYSVGVAANDNDEWMMAGKVSGDAYSVGLGLNSADTVTLVVSYDVSPALSLTGAFADQTAGSTAALQASYDLGGASLIGAVGSTPTADVASLGVFFSF